MKEAVTQDDHGEKQNADKVKAYTDPKKGEKKPFKSLRAETKIIKLGDKGKTATGKDAGAIDVEPVLNLSSCDILSIDKGTII